MSSSSTKASSGGESSLQAAAKSASPRWRERDIPRLRKKKPPSPPPMNTLGFSDDLDAGRVCDRGAGWAAIRCGRSHPARGSPRPSRRICPGCSGPCPAAGSGPWAQCAVIPTRMPDSERHGDTARTAPAPASHRDDLRYRPVDGGAVPHGALSPRRCRPNVISRNSNRPRRRSNPRGRRIAGNQSDLALAAGTSEVPRHPETSSRLSPPGHATSPSRHPVCAYSEGLCARGGEAPSRRRRRPSGTCRFPSGSGPESAPPAACSSGNRGDRGNAARDRD